MDRGIKSIVAFTLLYAPVPALMAAGYVFLASSERPASDWQTTSHVADVPLDGEPVRLVFRETHCDAWTRLDDRPLGAVFVRRPPNADGFQALNAFHGKFGCSVEYDPHDKAYKSVCFIVRFDEDGRVITNDVIEPGMYADLQRFETRVVDDVLFVKSRPLPRVR